MIDFKKTEKAGWAVFLSINRPDHLQMYSWCRETLGEKGKRWAHYGGWFYIFNEDDVILFKLRWD